METWFKSKADQLAQACTCCTGWQQVAQQVATRFCDFVAKNKGPQLGHLALFWCRSPTTLANVSQNLRRVVGDFNVSGNYNMIAMETCLIRCWSGSTSTSVGSPTVCFQTGGRCPGPNNSPRCLQIVLRSTRRDLTKFGKIFLDGPQVFTMSNAFGTVKRRLWEPRTPFFRLEIREATKLPWKMLKASLDGAVSMVFFREFL